MNTKYSMIVAGMLILSFSQATFASQPNTPPNSGASSPRGPLVEPSSWYTHPAVIAVVSAAATVLVQKADEKFELRKQADQLLDRADAPAWLRFHRDVCDQSALLRSITSEEDKSRAELELNLFQIEAQCHENAIKRITSDISGYYARNSELDSTSSEDVVEIARNDTLIISLKQRAACEQDDLNNVRSQISKMQATLEAYAQQQAK